MQGMQKLRCSYKFFFIPLIPCFIIMIAVMLLLVDVNKSRRYKVKLKERNWIQFDGLPYFFLFSYFSIFRLWLVGILLELFQIWTYLIVEKLHNYYFSQTFQILVDFPKSLTMEKSWYQLLSLSCSYQSCPFKT